jgi:hypothetical protein
MTEHEIVEDYSFVPDSHVLHGEIQSDNMCFVFCGRCGAAGVAIHAGPEDREATIQDAWEDFLRKVPWDCDESMVREVMRK